MEGGDCMMYDPLTDSSSYRRWGLMALKSTCSSQTKKNPVNDRRQNKSAD